MVEDSAVEDGIPTPLESSHANAHERDPALEQALDALIGGNCTDPFAYLGPHSTKGHACWVRILAPGAKQVTLTDTSGSPFAIAQPIREGGLFCAEISSAEIPERTSYRLRIDWPDAIEEVEDAYSFGPVLPETWLQRIAAGDGTAVREALGAHAVTFDGVPGVRFAVWAP
ncbi:MAG TPA: 1,4-alpha-glucan branching enzyme, partial [Pseudoxanthomonas sp.]|nr:1,4-alpha-glucan branching enzyme [Pseudoxanthomonas sp.]